MSGGKRLACCMLRAEGFLAKYAFPTEESMGEVERAKVVYRAALEAPKVAKGGGFLPLELASLYLVVAT